jgi:GntR family transcriptional regulator
MTGKAIWRAMIDRSSSTPYYAQLKDEILAQIERGIWKPGDQLPSEPDLCEQFCISRTVVRQALQELEFEGAIRREKGRGTFVSEPKIVEALAQTLTGFYQDMSGQGKTPLSKVLRQGVTASNPKIAGLLKLRAGETVLEIERLRFIDDEPLVLVTTWLPQRLVQGLEDVDFSGQSLYAVLEERYGLVIARSRRTLEAVGAHPRDAELLQVAVGTPLMQLDSVGYLEDGTPVETFHALHRGDRSRFEVELLRLNQPAGQSREEA